MNPVLPRARAAPGSRRSRVWFEQPKLCSAWGIGASAAPPLKRGAERLPRLPGEAITQLQMERCGESDFLVLPHRRQARWVRAGVLPGSPQPVRHRHFAGSAVAAGTAQPRQLLLSPLFSIAENKKVPPKAMGLKWLRSIF